VAWRASAPCRAELPLTLPTEGQEIDSLPHDFNLTDGHAYRRWLPAEEEVIARSATLFKSCTRRQQAEIERAYIADFHSLAGQTHDERAVGYLMCFTASIAIEIVANHLRLGGLSLALIEPCFDNLADIFRRHRVPMSPFPDGLLEADGDAFERALSRIDADAICLVTPNNPTGRALTEENLRRLLRFCKDAGKLLIMDTCFRAYLPRHLVHDQYRLILDADVDAVIFEDTGKTWPTSEIKAPFFATTRARGLYDAIYSIYTDFLLHVSPVGVRLAHEFIRLSMSDGLESIHKVVRDNREALHAAIAETFLVPQERPFASVSWLRLNAAMTGRELRRVLAERGLFVLPGNQFYWDDRRKGDRYIRVALTRDADMFRDAATLLGEVCRGIDIGPKTSTGGVDEPHRQHV
jgi:aspartate/methionine/tyrosine aminotransferase